MSVCETGAGVTISGSRCKDQMVVCMWERGVYGRPIIELDMKGNVSVRYVTEQGYTQYDDNGHCSDIFVKYTEGRDLAYLHTYTELHEWNNRGPCRDIVTFNRLISEMRSSRSVRHWYNCIHQYGIDLLTEEQISVLESYTGLYILTIEPRKLMEYYGVFDRSSLDDHDDPGSCHGSWEYWSWNGRDGGLIEFEATYMRSWGTVGPRGDLVVMEDFVKDQIDQVYFEFNIVGRIERNFFGFLSDVVIYDEDPIEYDRMGNPFYKKTLHVSTFLFSKVKFDLGERVKDLSAYIAQGEINNAHNPITPPYMGWMERETF